MAADWIIRGLMETPLIDVTDLEAVYAREADVSGRPIDPRTRAREDSAGIVIRGSYYLSGDSVLFQASIMDVASGRVLRSFEPVGAPSSAPATPSRRCGSESRPVSARWSIRVWGRPVDPDLTPPPSLSAYREFMAGLRSVTGSRGGALPPGGQLDSTFVAPLIQLACRAIWNDECPSRTRSAPCSTVAGSS